MKKGFVLWLAVGLLTSVSVNGEPSGLPGNYYFGDGTGVNCSLVLSTNGQFSFSWHGCLGVYAESSGTYAATNGLVSLDSKKVKALKGFSDTPSHFFSVPWGERMYLVQTNEIVAFCCDVNLGDEPRKWNWGQYYLRKNDWAKPVSGKPGIPEQWAKYLLDKPVTGKVTELISPEEGWLDVGKENGLIEGMILMAQGGKETLFSKVRVESVETKRYRIKCTWKGGKIVVGQTVSSRWH